MPEPMKRHPALVPLSHDHHRALVEARRLGRGAESEASERRAVAAGFLRFFATETLDHFREEEERLFPSLVDADGAGGELLVQALLEHQRIHALVGRLERGLRGGEADGTTMRELAELLADHVRLEERQLFPLVESLVSTEELSRLGRPPASHRSEPPVIDLSAPLGRGPVWGTETEDLNATLLAWPGGEGPDEHVNSERDVILLVLAGGATVTIDGRPHRVRAGEALIIKKGRSRSISADRDGVRYLSVHRRRAPLQIARRG